MRISTPERDARGLIRAQGEALGFDRVRFAGTGEAESADAHLASFVGEGRHGTMDWLARNLERRASPRALWPEAQSAIVVGANYGPSSDPLAQLSHADRGAISVYAQGDDYHDVLKSRLKQLARFVAGEFGADVKVFVDTAPVMEKPLAQSAGLGWQGKHTNLVSREFGSWLFIGSVFTTLELAPDEPEQDHCGACTRCLDACPTNAFTGPWRIDARRCISYLTIEHKGHIAEEFRAAMGNRIYGCDDCLAVCPWNKFASVAHDARFHARSELAEPRLADLACLDDVSFRNLFRASPIKRLGRDRFIRNVLIAIGNSGDSSLAPAAERLLDDPSPLVRAMAVWAFAQLSDSTRLARLREQHSLTEQDPGVRAEWDGVRSAPARRWAEQWIR